MSGGWILGNTIDGTQAEYVRMPHADTSLYHIPDGAEEDALVMLSDILPTGFECGVLNGKVQPGSTVAIVGAGPIGLATLLTAQFYSPAEIVMIDFDDEPSQDSLSLRCHQHDQQYGRQGCGKNHESHQRPGADTVIEAVGVPASFDHCARISSRRVASSPISGSTASKSICISNVCGTDNIAITTRLVDTSTTPMLLKTVQSRKIDPNSLITHRFNLDHIMDAYDTFGAAARLARSRSSSKCNVPGTTDDIADRQN